MSLVKLFQPLVFKKGNWIKGIIFVMLGKAVLEVTRKEAWRWKLYPYYCYYKADIVDYDLNPKGLGLSKTNYRSSLSYS